MSEKFILTKKELHLGYVKETFGAGAVIEHDKDNNRLIIEGRKFDDTRDLDILKRQAEKNPDEPWILPFSQETLQAVLSMDHEKVLPESKKDRKVGEMEIVDSDEDLQDSIDIRETQVSKRNNEAKEEAREAAKNREKDGKMEVIRGDEGVKERLARLEGKNDLKSISERAKLKEKMSMEVVPDDGTCGMNGGSKAAALNAGQSLPTREDVESKTEAVEEAKEARRRQIEANRKAAGMESPEEASGVSEATSEESEGASKEPPVQEMAPKETVDDIDAQIAALQAKKEAMQDGVDRVPVTDEDTAESVVEQE